ncbi:MAG: hydrolase [Flavobacteriaceae bacterium]
MKSKIFMYLFLFTLLLVLFQYMNQKSIFESQEEHIEALKSKQEKLTDSVSTLNDKVAELNYFTLQGNDNAMTYFDNLEMDSDTIEKQVTEAIYEKNLQKGGNPLIPLEGMYGEMRINKVKFLNHRWILADFSDGKYWGEMIIEYFYNDKMELELTPISSILYPN